MLLLASWPVEKPNKIYSKGCSLGNRLIEIRLAVLRSISKGQFLPHFAPPVFHFPSRIPTQISETRESSGVALAAYMLAPGAASHLQGFR